MVKTTTVYCGKKLVSFITIYTGGIYMTNKVRLSLISSTYGTYITQCVKNSTNFKGWQIHLNPKNTQLIGLNKGKTLIHQKGLLECLVVLKRLVKNLNTPTQINPPTPTQTVKQPK
jgi:hypothetical protein